MRDQSCPECNRLWRDYAIATTADIKLDGQMKISALRYDPGLSELLAPACEAATRERESLRQQIKQHEASHGCTHHSTQIRQ